MSQHSLEISNSDGIADEQELFIWSIPTDGNGMEIAERLYQITGGVFSKLREERMQRAFTVFGGDHVGVDIFIGLHEDDYPFLKELFTKSAGSFVTVEPEWRRFSSPKDGLAEPLFRYTPNIIKDYRDDDQIGLTYSKWGVEMTYFSYHPTFGDAESYHD